jgi:glycosyltransferase involved in cell wall biosynthesis
MKIGILGTRGIPNAYGGFEQFAQYLAEGLVKGGHELWVYNSSEHPYKRNEWQGIHIVHCKDLEKKIGTAGQFIYDLNCLRDAHKRKFDILLQLGYTSNSIWHWWWPKKSINIINMDGLEWKRSKYNPSLRKFLKRAEAWAVKYGDVLIADSPGIRDHILKKYNKPSIYIPYGAKIFQYPDFSCLTQWDLHPKEYFLVISRMEPENNIEMIIDGYLHSNKPFPLILVGKTNNGFGNYLVKKYQDKKIRFLGSIYDEPLINNLRYYCAFYIHGHSVGGTNPSLLEAMSCACLIAAHRNIFNQAVLTDCAFYFDQPEELSNIIDNIGVSQIILADYVQRNLEKIRDLYSWDKIIDEYEHVFFTALAFKSEN